jgi:anti-sigma factor RsiW
MRCAQVDPYIEAFVDGSLDLPRASVIDAHVGSCARCAARARAAGRVSRALSAAPPVRAPRGFAGRVMDVVYREALAGGPGAASGVRPPSRLPARVYRRLGLSCMLTAGVLAVSLFIPRAAYSTLAGTGIAGTAFSRESAGAVKSALDGADNAVRAILRERAKEGSGR